MQKEVKTIREEFISRGVVLGTLWDFQTGAYPARKLTGKSEKEIIEQAEKMLDNNSLDDGMGFQSLKAATLEIEKITFVEIDGKLFENHESNVVTLGELTEQEDNFLFEYFDAVC